MTDSDIFHLSSTVVMQVIRSWETARQCKGFEEQLGIDTILMLCQMDPQAKLLFGFTVDQEMRGVQRMGLLIHGLRIVKMLDAIFDVLGPDPTLLTAVVANWGQEHGKLGMSAEHFTLMCRALLQVLEDIMGNEWNAELRSAWFQVIRLVSMEIAKGMSARMKESCLPLSSAEELFKTNPPLEYAAVFPQYSSPYDDYGDDDCPELIRESMRSSFSSIHSARQHSFLHRSHSSGSTSSRRSLLRPRTSSQGSLHRSYSHESLEYERSKGYLKDFMLGASSSLHSSSSRFGSFMMKSSSSLRSNHSSSSSLTLENLVIDTSKEPAAAIREQEKQRRRTLRRSTSKTTRRERSNV